jgi:hypothetical protein
MRKKYMIFSIFCVAFLGAFIGGPEFIASAAWQVHSTPPFQYNRFDGVFVPGPSGAAWANKVYFMGGRTDSATESPDIWSFDPLTGAYTDTGHNMLEDVSNYTANLIMDDGTGRGPAIYVIGGYDRDVAVGPIGMVQRYYPQTGVIENLPTDPYADYVSGNLVTPGGTAVVNDVIYVFGGYTNVAAPYFSDKTWQFDPKRPGHTRWLPVVGVTLNPARGYIQTAVVGTKIYAMGGDSQYVAGDLVPTDVVQVLDTANLAAGWTTLAPMPVASGEGQGFGFDTTSGVGPAWENKVYVVGGGDWPSQIAEVMEYDVATNTWNQAFPDLNQARRDHAGVFIPLCTPDPNDGLPGMWVFGGRITSDSPPFGDAEFQPLTCATDPVYRFWSPYSGSHFYTISQAERDYVIATWPDYWDYEGVAFNALLQ